MDTDYGFLVSVPTMKASFLRETEAGRLKASNYMSKMPIGISEKNTYPVVLSSFYKNLALC